MKTAQTVSNSIAVLEATRDRFTRLRETETNCDMMVNRLPVDNPAAMAVIVEGEERPRQKIDQAPS